MHRSVLALSPYARAVHRPVLSSRMGLPGADFGLRIRRGGGRRRGGASGGRAGVCPYAMSGTDIVYCDRVWCYASTMQCA
eukprot:439651-Rhodomonas_salina.1